MSDVTIIDGSTDFSGGVDSHKVTTIASPRHPNGLRRDQLAWLNNATVRGGGITQRSTWQKLARIALSGLFQGGYMYEPDEGYPYAVVSISGIIYKIDCDTGVVTQLTTPGLENPATVEQAFFVQAEQFLIIQAGDYVTLPLFWDGTTLRRSNGLTGVISSTAPSSPVTYTVVASQAWVPPVAIGSSVPVYMSSGQSTEHILQRIQVTDSLGVIIGQFQVTNATANGEQWTDIAAIAAGAQPAGTYFATFVSPATDTLNPNASWVLPAVSQDVIITHAAPMYDGNVGDTVVIQNQFAQAIGTFYVVDFGNTAIKLKTISSARIGETIPSTWDLVMAITAPTTAGPALGISELPAGGPMDYYMGRVWYGFGRSFGAGDIVGGPSGTTEYDHRDSVLRVTENNYLFGGDHFAVPTTAGNVRALAHTANLDETLGESELYVFTRKTVYSFKVPVDRQSWIAVTADTIPRLRVVQRNNGAVNDRSVVPVNGDLFFQSLEPTLRSLQVATRNFYQWGNTPIAIEERRILRFNNRALLHFASGIEFDNRMLQTALPVQTPVGVAHQAVIPLNFDVVSTLNAKLPPVWEGMYEGVDFLQLYEGDFGGRTRAFTAIHSRNDSSIEFWEMTDSAQFENGDNRVSWQIEFPAFTWGDEFAMKKLVGAELWIDRLFGEVVFTLEWRNDSNPCWNAWHTWKECTARNCEEDVSNPVCYPVREYCESYRATKTVGRPPQNCDNIMGRPAYYGYQIQPRLTILGFCRIRGILLHAHKVMEKLYGNPVC